MTDKNSDLQTKEEVEHLLDIKDSLNQLIFAASHLNEVFNKKGAPF